MSADKLIRSLRESKKFTQEQLAKMVGVSRVSISKWESGENKPKGDHLFSLAAALGVDAVILVDEAHRSTPGTPGDVSSIIGGAGLVNFTATPAESPHSNTEPATLGDHKVPVLSCVQAGAWTEPCEMRDFEGNIEYITTFEDVGPRTFAIWIKGRSMEPLFEEGDLIVCDPDISPHPGDYVVAKNGSEEATFKKYRPRGFNPDGVEYFELVPLNEDYAPIRSDMCQVSIIGTMVEHRKYRRRK